MLNSFLRLVTVALVGTDGDVNRRGKREKGDWKTGINGQSVFRAVVPLPTMHTNLVAEGGRWGRKALLKKWNECP